MNLLFLSRSSFAGGGQRWLETVARGLTERGHECRIIFTRSGHRRTVFHKRLKDLAEEDLCYRFTDPDYIGDISRFVNDWRPDRILIDNDERMLELRTINSRLQSGTTKVVFIAHTQGTPVSYLEELRPVLWKVICVSHRSAALLNGFNPVVIHNGVNPPPAFWSPTPFPVQPVREALAISCDAFVVGYLGRHDTNKNTRSLFDVIKGTDWYLILAGPNAPSPPPEMDAATKDRIRVHADEVEYVADWYGAMNVWVLPSKEEGFPLGPMEALLCGSRVAMTPTSDYPALFGDAIAFFPYGDVDAMRDAILAAPGAHHGRKIIEQHLTVEKMLDKYEEALR